MAEAKFMDIYSISAQNQALSFIVGFSSFSQSVLIKKVLQIISSPPFPPLL